MVDWQTLGVGLPARDLAYFTATSLKPDLRASIEKDLVDDYHRASAVTASPTTTAKPVGGITDSA